MTVGELKDLLINLSSSLHEAEDEIELPLVSNTYFLKGAQYFLGVGGEGYLDLSNLEELVFVNSQPLADDINAISMELTKPYRRSSEGEYEEYDEFIAEVEAFTGMSLVNWTVEEMVNALDAEEKQVLQQTIVDVYYRDLFYD